MVDIFDEVAEDLRAERAARLMKRYGWLLGVLAVAVVAGAVGWQLWTRHTAQVDAAAAAQYVAALNAIEQTPPTGAKTGPLASLDQLSATAPEGYRTLARLRAAALKADAGDLPGAEALWNEVAADPNADPLIRDIANLLATERQLDSGDPAQLTARLEPLATFGNPVAALANEQLALLDLRQGKTDAARTKLKTLSTDIIAPSGVRARAAALLAGLGPQAQS